MSAQYTKNNKKTAAIFGAKTAPLVMGILNITSDSFYDGGKYLNPKDYLQQAQIMLEQGADIIDIGAQSTRPGATDIGQNEEQKQLCNAIALVRQHFPDVIISADTYRANVASSAVQEGADIINDISGGNMDAAMYTTIAQLQVPYILMHMQGTPQTMQQHPLYKNVSEEVKQFFTEQLAVLHQLGAHEIIIDPGFGFGKTMAHNYQLLNELETFHTLKKPVLVGVSRKSMIWKLLNTSPELALNGTTVVNTLALLKGANILRVHDVKEAKEAITILQQLK